MSNLSFGSFVWPEDPENYEETCIREPEYVKTEDGAQVFRGMSPVRRTVKGSGVFFGEKAYENFKALAAMTALDTPAQLVHPVWGSRSAYLTEVKATQEARADYVAYSFTFREADANGDIPS